jgi:hypothetical protein
MEAIMPRFLYRYMELLSVIGAGTPEDPGGDFGMSVWIDAANALEASAWGKRVLEDYVRARYRYSDPDIDPAQFEGEIITDIESINYATDRGYPVCKVGQIPLWSEPWRHDNAPRRKPR